MLVVHQCGGVQGLLLLKVLATGSHVRESAAFRSLTEQDEQRTRSHGDKTAEYLFAMVVRNSSNKTAIIMLMSTRDATSMYDTKKITGTGSGKPLSRQRHKSKKGD